MLGSVDCGCLQQDEQRQAFEPRSLSVLTLGREEIAEITTFLGAELPCASGSRTSSRQAMDFQPLPYPSRHSGSFRHQRHP